MATCSIKSPEHRSVLTEYGTPGERVTPEVLAAAQTLFERGEIDGETLQAVFENWQSGCTIPGSVTVSLDALRSPEKGVVIVDWTSRNSGSAPRQVAVTVDGEQVATETVPPEPYAGRTRVTGVPDGKHDVCVEAVK